MKSLNAIFFIVTLFSACFLTSIVPYNSTSILNIKETQIINDKYENEEVKNITTQTTTILNLDWFECMNDIFKKNQKTLVIDCQTLTSYYVIRTGGSNHADVETMTEEDTAKFKSLYREWSWSRRPVWVKINDVYYAGSINGYPHGYSTIVNNNENGHTCIHFLNSKTHGTKRVDESHQNAVANAYNEKNKLIDYLKK